MAQREIQIDSIITQMNLDNSLKAIFDGRIYRGKPISDVQEGTYMILNIITKPVIEQAYSVVRVEARIIGKDTSTTIKTLMTAKNAVTDYLERTSLHSGFETYKIAEGGNFFNGLDEKLRGVLVQDYLFYFAIFN